MTIREATDAEMLAAVERWARARGIFRAKHQVGFNYQKPRPACPWLVRFRRASVEIFHWDFATPFAADPHTALLWALLVEAGITVDVGRCPACIKRGGSWDYTDSPLKPPNGPGEEWEYIGKGIKSLPDGIIGDLAWERCTWRFEEHWYRRACQSCLAVAPPGYPDEPTGRDVRELARLVLDAAPQPSADLSKPAKYGRAKCSGCGYGIATTRTGLIRSHTGPGPGARCSGSGLRPDTVARDHVDVCATKWQTLGNPIGEWLALWLAGKREGTADAVDRLDAITSGREGSGESYSFPDGEVIEARLV